MRFAFTRHATTEWNLKKKIQGHTDIPLCPEGEVEARELAKALTDAQITMIVSSDLLRSKQTAQIISHVLSIPELDNDARLRECSFGTLEGMTKEELISKLGEHTRAWWDDPLAPYDFRPFGGEHRDQVLLRYTDALRSFARFTPKEFPLIIGHGRALTTLFSAFGRERFKSERGIYYTLDLAF